MKQGSLRGLFTAQFWGAFNDNAWKLLVTFLAIQSLGGVGAAAQEQMAQARTTLIFVVFSVPFLLLSLPAGALADRMSKRRIIVALKGVELFFMVVGTAFLWLEPDAWHWGVVVLGLMGAQSALFSPAKYGIVPELVPHERLSRSNAYLQLLTFLAIVLGTASAGALLDLTGSTGFPLWAAGVPLIGFSAIGFVAARSIPAVPVARETGGLAESIRGGWGALRGDRSLWLTVLGLTWFWGVTSFLGQDLLVCAKSVLGLSDTLAGGLLATFGLCVGAGSLLASRISGRQVETGLIPLGAIGFAVCTLSLAFAIRSVVPTFLVVGALGVSSGLLSVPLQALLQWKSPREVRGGVLALAGFLTMGGTLAGSLGVGALAASGLSGTQILLAGGVVTVLGTAWALWLLPDALLRLVLILLTHTFYRLRVVGAQNIPEEGGALLVPNHVSFVDGLFLMAATDRRVRFIVDSSYYNHRMLRPFMKALGAIPISAAGGPRVVLRALRDAGDYLDQGHVVCIFAEGQLTRTGQLLPFRRGMERITKGRDVPIVPVHLDRVWGSIFSRAGGRFLFKLPRQIPYPVTVSFGTPMPADTSPFSVRQAVIGLGEEAWRLRQQYRSTLHRSFLSVARRSPFRFSLGEERDGEPVRLSRIRVVASAIALARVARIAWKDQEAVGVLLPPSIGGVLVNIAAALSGRTSVNLNFTAGKDAMASAASQAGLKTVVTSAEFLDKARVELPENLEPVFAEDLKDRVSIPLRLFSLGMAFLAPHRMIEKFCGASRTIGMEDPATIIFSSGSTGEPKGVVLTHANLDANVEGASQVLDPTDQDTALGILPLFHSFGYFLLWFGINHGVKIVLHPSPLDAAAIGDLVGRYKITILVTTPTFLQLYMRRCTPGQFGALRLVITGAEKLPETVARAFEEKFGIRPLEGYGATECAPVVSVNAPGFRAPGFFQQAGKLGSVGHPLPGIAVRVVDPESHATMEQGVEGMILVRGPNVMRGYLHREDLTKDAFLEDWYITGDIGYLDEEGFLHITDRLSRFSKIGGEMVPHGKVEEALQNTMKSPLRLFAVTGIPDPKKGERLAVLHTLNEERIPVVLEKLEESGLPNLFIPRRDAFVKVEELPMLGTGKLDLKAVRRIALEQLG